MSRLPCLGRSHRRRSHIHGELFVDFMLIELMVTLAAARTTPNNAGPDAVVTAAWLETRAGSKLLINIAGRLGAVQYSGDWLQPPSCVQIPPRDKRFQVLNLIKIIPFI